MKHVPNTLTAVRIAVTPLLIYLLLRESFAGYSWAFILFVLASLSDWLDGRIARQYRVGTRLGQFLDPFADKVLVLGTFATLSYLMPERIPWWAVALLALRGFAVTALRSWLEGRGRSLTTRKSAKLKTAAQLTFLIVLLILLSVASGPASWFGSALISMSTQILASGFVFWGLMLVVAVTLYTGAVYFTDISGGSHAAR